MNEGALDNALEPGCRLNIFKFGHHQGVEVIVYVLNQLFS